MPCTLTNRAAATHRDKPRAGGPRNRLDCHQSVCRAASAASRSAMSSCDSQRPRSITPSSCLTADTSSSGFAASSNRSADRPTATRPNTSLAAKKSAGCEVPVVSARYGVRPASTYSSSSSSADAPGTLNTCGASDPSKTPTPAASSSRISRRRISMKRRASSGASPCSPRKRPRASSHWSTTCGGR